MLARAAYNASNIFVNIVTSYQLRIRRVELSPETAYFWAGTCLLSATWVFFRVLSPKVCQLPPPADYDDMSCCFFIYTQFVCRDEAAPMPRLDLPLRE